MMLPLGRTARKRHQPRTSRQHANSSSRKIRHVSSMSKINTSTSRRRRPCTLAANLLPDGDVVNRTARAHMTLPITCRLNADHMSTEIDKSRPNHAKPHSIKISPTRPEMHCGLQGISTGRDFSPRSEKRRHAANPARGKTSPAPDLCVPKDCPARPPIGQVRSIGPRSISLEVQRRVTRMSPPRSLSLGGRRRESCF